MLFSRCSCTIFTHVKVKAPDHTSRRSGAETAPPSRTREEYHVIPSCIITAVVSAMT